jgi:hypothetical protein
MPIEAREKRPAMSTRIGSPRLLMVLLGLAVPPLGCAPKKVAYPDATPLAAAEKTWCDALAKYEAPQDQSWRHTAACTAATPTGSAPFVAQVADCYRKHHEEQGENAIDLGGVAARCADVVLGAAEPVGFEQAEPIRERCARMERCSKVPKEQCMASLEHLDPMQKVGLTSAYNLAAQHTIAECLATVDCSADEDAAVAGCYETAAKQRVWLPPN